jgi:hypothetical protein
MSTRARALILGATLAAMNLAGMTAVAHAQANDDPDGKDVRRLATERQAETWRKHPVTSQQQPAADAALRRVLAREHSSIPSGTPAQVPAPTRAPDPSGQPGWLVASVGGLAVVLALIAGLAVLAAKHARRRARVEHVA